MVQKTSPFTEGKYGWNYGESGWNGGMDENLLKFSYLFDSNVDTITGTLPAAINGQAHFLTTDNRIYYVVENTYYSTPVPKWYEFKLRSTGQLYRFNGTTTVAVDDVNTFGSRITTLENEFETITDPTGMDVVGALDGFVGDYLPARVHIRKYGVVSDGVTDDSDALEAAISAGVPLDFGTKPVRITRRISALLTQPLDWKSDGCTILNYAAAETPACLDIEVQPNQVHRIVGVLKIDGRLLSSVGIRVWNKSAIGFPLGYASFYASDLQVENIRRGSISSANGDGIIIRGGWTSVTLDRPVVKNVLLAAGAGIIGSVGVTGITVFGVNTGYPILTTINDPTIDTIKSEDPAYNADQDGVRVFGPWDTAGAKTNSSFILRGGTFRDCWGRSVKSQGETGVISGTNFSAFSGPTGGRSNEIDFQVGGGMVSNITAYYAGAQAVPTEVVSFQPSPTFEAFSGTVRGVQVVTTDPMVAVVSTFPRAKTQHQITVRDIDVIGPVARLVEFRVWSNLTRLLLDGCTISGMTGQLVRVTASGASGSPYVGNVTIKNANNLGSAIPLVTDKVAGLAANSVVSTQDVYGFTLPPIQAESGANLGGATRVNALIGMDSSSGALSVESKAVTAGATVAFPLKGYNTATLIGVSIGAGNLSHGLVAASSAGVVNLTTGATDIVTGTTADPGSGNYRLWISGGAIQVRNTTGNNRQVTLFYMG